ncbi:MAG: hypothetical protein NTV80_21880 [Verrucomicrobia bacterium]|nr:hypothetical protein [Verrucomicrobiota bacterium]
MLDAQRYKPGTLRSEVYFARYFAYGHVILGALPPLFFLLHACYACSAGVLIWYLLTLGLIYGMALGRDACRKGLSVVFAILPIFGVYFLAQVLPEWKVETPPLLPLTALPFWLGLWNLTYAAAAVFVWQSTYLKKACSIGFKLY